MRAYLFPGQGSQCRGMGKELFALFPDYTAQANELLGYSIEALCVEDAQQQLNKTEYTQPALYIVNALTYLSLIKETNQKPDYVAGHSLGEYNALFAAEAFDFITGLTLVQKRGELMSKAKGGAMAAVLGLSFAQLTHILEEHQLTTITVANYNSYQQLVISGPKITMEQVGSLLTSLKDVTFIPLSVSGAFHSPY
ncbi:MAG: acyltransferase domain-containing protein, partial [bacterium]|nr:acyltransferase domain-containing protein [bacterium]